MTRFLSKAAGVYIAITALASTMTAAIAQNGQLAEARHAGTYNYLRVAPNRDAHIIEKMRQGTRFVVVGEEGKYYAVVLEDGVRGWTAKVNVAFIGQ